MGFSMASCADGLAISEGVASTARHAPSIFNTAYNRWMYWDGRCDSHWCQALSPIEDPNEMNFTRLEVAHLMASESDLSDAEYIIRCPTSRSISSAPRLKTMDYC